MIRLSLVAVAVSAALGAFANVAPAEEKKDVKLTGTLVCGKCGLKATPKCSNALQVKEGDQVVTYFLEDRGNKEPYHEEVCGDGKLAGVAVVGTVTEKDGKKWVKVTKLDLPGK